MKRCFHSVSLPDRPLLELIEMVARAGYQAIEINSETLPWAQPHLTPSSTSQGREAVVSAARTHGLTIPAVGAHIEMVNSDPSKRAAAVTFVKGCIDLAVDLDAPVVHILSGPLDEGEERETAWPWFRDAVVELTNYGTERKIVLAIEAIAGHLFHSVDDYHRLFKEVAGTPFKINFDPSHLIVQGIDPIRIVDELGDAVVHVHLKDGKGSWPESEFPPLGSGNVDFRRIVSGLQRAAYTGAFSVEYEAQVYGYSQTEEEIIMGGKAFMDSMSI